MNRYRTIIAAAALCLMATGTAAAQMRPAPMPKSQADQHAQHHPEGQSPGMAGGVGMMDGMMNPQMMHQMMQHMAAMGGSMGMAGGGMPCPDAQQGSAELTPETVRQHLEAHVAMNGNDRIQVGDVTRQDDGRIVASIVTRKEGVVVDKFAIDPRTHARTRVD